MENAGARGILFHVHQRRTVGLWMLTERNGEYWLGLQPIYPGLATSAGCFIFETICAKAFQFVQQVSLRVDLFQLLQLSSLNAIYN
jgi:hypothetical protein